MALSKSTAVLAAFFFCGLINNLVYVVFLSAAVDILESNTHIPKGVVLLADILPSFLVKLVAPHIVHHFTYGTRLIICSLASFSALHIVASFQALPLRLAGVVLASAASGLGELSFLMLTTFFPSAVVATWSSGTGGAGVCGSVAFLVLTTWLRLSTPNALRLISLLPPFLAIFYFWYLKPYLPRMENPEPLGIDDYGERPAVQGDSWWYSNKSAWSWLRSTHLGQILMERFAGYQPLGTSTTGTTIVGPTLDADDEISLQEDPFVRTAIDSPSTAQMERHPVSLDVERKFSQLTFEPGQSMSFSQRLAVVRLLLPLYILPLLVVYWAEYTINQGVSPTILFPLSSSPWYPFEQLKDHYIYYQALYQIGVFISRSSVHWFPIKHLWYPSGAQVAVLFVMISQALYGWLPSVWPVFCIIFFEGLLGGATYVNTFFNIRNDVPLAYREFSLGVVGVGDSIGITLAGLTALWLEPSLCHWQLQEGNPLCTQL
ncbi:battenin CLN3 protein [Dispira parvispora]|uniref:Protein BTN n=1 Tax=Dispira parvispora TaxID=1520584 RepID=A0A9W8AU42_9FUNG|nr:battenin CLN3 protein [Dispira parvispora]